MDLKGNCVAVAWCGATVDWTKLWEKIWVKQINHVAKKYYFYAQKLLIYPDKKNNHRTIDKTVDFEESPSLLDSTPLSHSPVLYTHLLSSLALSTH